MKLDRVLTDGSTDKRLEILRLVGASGSISEAARLARVSYKAAWQALDTLTNLAGANLVQREVGGSGGGGARLTAAGEQLLVAAQALAVARDGVFRRLRHGQGSGQAPAQALALMNLQLRTSMRNQLPCRVLALEPTGQGVHVQLHLLGEQAGSGGAGGANETLVSSITRESAELLGLTPGLDVLAMIKATAVAILVDATPSASNHLTGRVVRMARVSGPTAARGGHGAKRPAGPSAREVAVALGGGLRLVGFAPADAPLKTRARVTASFMPSSVVIAVAS